MNSNQIRYLKSVLENSTNQRLSFKVKSEVVVDYSKEGMVNISLDDIDTINKGKKELFVLFHLSQKFHYGVAM